MVEDGTVTAIDGSIVRLHADSVCVHGDSPGAVAMATAVRKALEHAGIAVRSFAACDGSSPSVSTEAAKS